MENHFDRGDGPHLPVIFRLAVTGHRDAPSELLAPRVTEVLAAVRKGVASRGGSARLFSALAEGADRVAAGIALDLGLDLQCPLPFPATKYEDDMRDEASKAEFRSLAAQASAVFELDGAGDHADSAYEAVGGVLVRNADCLISVWDGLPARGRGGTAQVTAYARARGIPVIWIHANAPHQVRLLAPASDSGPVSAEDIEAWTAGQCGRCAPHAPAAASSLSSLEVWADGRARSYTRLYRWVFRANCLLGAVAVLCALLTYHYPNAHGWTLAELAIIVFIAISVLLGNHWNWHEQWLQHRSLAEHARILRLLQPLGASFRVPALPPHQAAPNGNAAMSRMQIHWLARGSGLPGVRTTPAYIEQCRQSLRQELQSQIEYHERASHRAHRRHTVLERLTLALFAVTLVSCLLHLATGAHVFTLASAFCPVLSAAAAGVMLHGEFSRVAQRSAAMAATLRQLASPLDCPGLGYAELAALAEETGQAMLAELLDWEMLFQAKPLVLPS